MKKQSELTDSLNKVLGTRNIGGRLVTFHPDKTVTCNGIKYENIEQFHFLQKQLLKELSNGINEPKKKL